MQVGNRLRRFLLLAHILTSVGMIGAVASFLVLAVRGLNGDLQGGNPYPAMGLLTTVLITPLVVLSLVMGTVQALVTPWGLFRHYWVVAKLIATLLVLVVLLNQTQSISLLAGLGTSEIAEPLWATTRFSMVLHAGGGLATLLMILTLSVYKPRGLTRYGWNRSHHNA